MRPLRLTLSGFTSFRDEVSLDLGDLDLFVICGPTGAGKSSLLDAVTYALYGEISRSDRRGSVADFMSLGKSRLEVGLEFVLRDRRYRVTRSATRRRSGTGVTTQVRLDHFATDHFETLAEGVARVDDLLRQMLGMSCEAFTQTVVLPQGQFAVFLQSEPRKRRQMLNEILRLQVYERMQKEANQKRNQLDGEAKALDRRLADTAGTTTPEEVARARAELRAVEETSTRLQGEVSRLRDDLTQATQRHDVLTEFRQKEAELCDLLRREPAVADIERRLRLAQVVPAILPLLDRAEDEQQALAKLQRDAVEGDRALEAAAADHARAVAEREAAERAASEVPTLDRRRQLLLGIAGKIALRARLDDEVRLLEASLAKKSARLAEGAERKTRLAQEEKGLQDDLARTEAELRTLEDARTNVELADRGEPLAQELRAARGEGTRLASDVKERLRQAEATEAEYRRAEELRARCEAELRDRVRAHADGVAARERHRRAHLVGELRRNLSPGDPCPVCLQAISGTLPDETNARAEVDVACLELAVESHRRALEQATRRAAGAEEAWLQARRRAEEGEAELKPLRSRFTALERQLRTLVTALAASAGGPLEERFATWAQQARAAWERRSHLDREASVAREKAQTLVTTRDSVRRDLADLLEESARDTDRLQRARAELRQVAGEMEEAGASANPQRDLEEVTAAIEARNKALTDARLAEVRHSEILAGARERRRECAAGLTGAMERATASRAKAEQAWHDAGFTGAADVRAAALAPDEVNRLDAEARAFHRDRDRVTRRVEELRPLAAGPAVTAMSLEALRATIPTREQQAKAAYEKVVQGQHEVGRLEGVLELRGRIERERQDVEERLAVYRQLSEDLKSDRFQAYMLEETMTELMRGASAQLARLSGDRFGLDFRDDEIQVIDQDNAGERRSTDTLSGGETFLASLALALELSDQVLRSVGAVALDCLFIDEGFGSLDPDTLRVVTDSIRCLQVGGRMVGIITHVPELVEQFDQRIIVEKRSGASSIRMTSSSQD